MAFVGGDSWERVPLGLNSLCWFLSMGTARQSSDSCDISFICCPSYPGDLRDLQWSAVPEWREMPGTLPGTFGDIKRSASLTCFGFHFNFRGKASK